MSFARRLRSAICTGLRFHAPARHRRRHGTEPRGSAAHPIRAEVFEAHASSFEYPATDERPLVYDCSIPIKACESRLLNHA